jgi:hypothetical protein
MPWASCAKRDLRMNKAKQKFLDVSGLMKWSTFARIRSYISTIRKQSGQVVDSPADAFNGSSLFLSRNNSFRWG